MKCALCRKAATALMFHLSNGKQVHGACADNACVEELARKEARIKSGNDCMTCSNEATDSEDPPCATCCYQIGDYNNWTKKQ